MRPNKLCSTCGTNTQQITRGLCPKCSKREYRSQPCSHVGCHRKRARRDLCNFHNMEGIKNGTIIPRDTSRKICSEPGCDSYARSKGLCSVHYKRMRNRLNPNFDPSKSIVEREILGIEYKTEKIKRSSEKKISNRLQIDDADLVNGNLSLMISASTLASKSNINIKELRKVLSNLVEDGLLVDFLFDKKTQVVTLTVRHEISTAFTALLNMPHKDVIGF